MWTDDDLPDHDYASIYGEAALTARQTARFRAWYAAMDAMLESQRQTIARLDAGLAQFAARHRDRRHDR